MISSLETLKEDFQKIGIGRSDVLIVHSSLSSMGIVEGGADTVIQALTEVLGSEGTLLFPAFTYRYVYENPIFSMTETPACVGIIAETFRKSKDVIRSVHPSHSVCARGRYAEEIIKNHGLDRTPMGINSPYRRLADYNAKILMLGCSLNTMSYMHALEEEAEVEYCLTPYKINYTIIDSYGNEYTDEYQKHYFKRKSCVIKQCYSRCIDVLTEGIDYTKEKIHSAESYLVNAKALHDKALLKMKTQPYYFVDLPEGYTQGVN